MMNLFGALYARRSVREYTADAIDERDLRDLIDAAIQAPNAMNRQAWRFVVISDRRMLKRVGQAAKGVALATLDGAPELAPLRKHLSDASFDIFYGAPVLVVIWTAVGDDMAVHDCCLAAENLMLAASIKNLGSCWIGFAEAWLATAEARRELGIDPAGRPVAPIILGHPQRLPPAPGRAPAQIHWIR